MRNMILTLAAPALMLTLVGCGGGPVGTAESFADDVCACDDAECVKKVVDEYKDKGDDMKTDDLSDDDKKKLEAAAEKAAKCMIEKG